jgi:hypothetical protein
MPDANKPSVPKDSPKLESGIAYFTNYPVTPYYVEGHYECTDGKLVKITHSNHNGTTISCVDESTGTEPRGRGCLLNRSRTEAGFKLERRDRMKIEIRDGAGKVVRSFGVGDRVKVRGGVRDGRRGVVDMLLWDEAYPEGGVLILCDSGDRIHVAKEFVWSDLRTVGVGIVKDEDTAALDKERAEEAKRRIADITRVSNATGNYLTEEETRFIATLQNRDIPRGVVTRRQIFWLRDLQAKLDKETEG